MEGLLAIGKHTFIHTYIHTSFHGKQIRFIYIYMYKNLIRTISRKKYLKGNFKYTANTFYNMFISHTTHL